MIKKLWGKLFDKKEQPVKKPITIAPVSVMDMVSDKKRLDKLALKGVCLAMQSADIDGIEREYMIVYTEHSCLGAMERLTELLPYFEKMDEKVWAMTWSMGESLHITTRMHRDRIEKEQKFQEKYLRKLSRRKK